MALPAEQYADHILSRISRLDDPQETMALNRLEIRFMLMCAFESGAVHQFVDQLTQPMELGKGLAN